MKNKMQVRKEAFKYLCNYGNNLKAKFTNICSKTGSYDVPPELFQKRTPRKNRSLISWSAVKSNALTLEQLDTFEGGVVVNFINNDFFDKDNFSNEVFNALRLRLGSNDNVSSIISIKSEDGSSSSAIPREAFSKLINNTMLVYNGLDICINQNNYEQYVIKQDITGKGTGNETWSGFLYISIKGGQQDTIETHKGQNLTLFNPACEYASQDVCEDINLVMAYYALKSISEENIKSVFKDNSTSKISYHNNLISRIEELLIHINYRNESYTGNLYDYVKNQYSLSLIPGQLTDPIQIKKIDINKFNITSRTEDSIDFTHEEAVIFEKYYWDEEKKCILSPARPTNVFWSYHLSNMMQQNFSLQDYFIYENERFKKRKKLIENGEL